MTGMLASVTSVAEAHTVLNAGVDIIDLKDPQAGALGALPLKRVSEIVEIIGMERPLSATIGDLPLVPLQIHDAAAEMAETGVDIVKVGLFTGPGQRGCVAALAPLCASGKRIVIVLFADQQPDLTLLPRIAASGCSGVMLDTADKHGGGLTACLTQDKLRSFVRQAKELGLLTGLAGSLRAEDIPQLLPLGSDYLGFRGALCTGVRTSALSFAAVRQIRTLIPQSVNIIEQRMLA